MHDVKQAREFVEAITGSADSIVTFQAFYDPKGVTPPAGVAKVWHSTVDASVEFIDYKQSQLAGIYICINGTDLKGREIYNINHLRVLFADFDGIEQPVWNLQPHLTQQRDQTHGHAFWLIDAGDLTHDEWSILQKQIALYYGTDEQVHDPSRVVRLPGSLHLKNPASPQTYSITSNVSKSVPRYTIEQIRSAHVLSAEKDAILNQWAEKRAGIDNGVGYEDDPIETRKFINFISNAALPAVLGTGSHELFRVACFGHDHGISLENAKKLLWEHYNPRCLPAWNDDERHHFDGVVYRGYHYATSAAGCKTARAEFMALPPLPEPNCGWQNEAAQFNVVQTLQPESLAVTTTPAAPDKIGDIFRWEHRLTKDQGLIVAAQLTVKSSHYDFARVFDGINYDGVRLIRCAKQFYVFNGKSWGVVDDDVIRSAIQRAFAVFKPADKFTSGVFNCLKDHVNVPAVENGTWLSERKTSTSNYTVFANGIVDLNSDVLTLMPHTPEFFTLNELEHDFNTGAKCPNWLSFLTSVWDDNDDMKMQLQEFFGYCLTSDVSLQKFAALVGKSRAGKGVMTDVMTAMVGSKNIAAPALPNLASSTALHEMSTKSLTLIPDAHNVNGNAKDLVLSNLKAITGGDNVSFHEIYKGSRNTKFKTKLVLSTNNVPNFNDPSGALVNRMLVFIFYKSFADNPDTSLRTKLLAEIAGITQWAIEGLRRLRRNGGKFTEGRIGLIQKERIRKDMFPLSEFVESSCSMQQDEFTMLDDLYNAYRLWAATEGLKNPLIKNEFDKSLRNSALNIQPDDTGRRGFYGITVKVHLSSGNVIGFPPVGNVQ
jgi:P4 family phage/plasmid primase-like protien